MFTGIVKVAGRIAKVEKIKKAVRIVIKTDSNIARCVDQGESVSVDGVCLTAICGQATKLSVARPQKRECLTFELMDSTLKLTTLGLRRVGDIVNIEPAMRAHDIVGGHFISGHVDGVGSVKRVWIRGRTRYLSIAFARQLARYVVPQGSITVNGVSLTVVDVKKDFFSVALTSYTATHTNLGAIKIRDKVNIEADMFAKYIFKFLNHYAR